MGRGSASSRPRANRRRCSRSSPPPSVCRHARASRPGSASTNSLRTQAVARGVGQLRAPARRRGTVRRCGAAGRTQVCILATSREGLAVDGEHMRALRSLSVPDPSATSRRWSGVMRADCSSNSRRRWILPSCWMQPPAPQWGAVQTARRHPLAIELAAARIVAMTPAENAGSPRRTVPAPDRWAPCRGRAAPDASRHRRLVLLALLADRVSASSLDSASSREASARARHKRSQPVRVSSAGMSSRRLRASSRSPWWSATAPPTAAPDTRCLRRFERTHASASTTPTTPTTGVGITPSTSPASQRRPA